jgi:hypothetical protein
MLWYSESTFGRQRTMISVAIRGYGIVVWDDTRGLRTYGITDRLSATLSDRVEHALGSLASTDEGAIRDALLGLSGSLLLAEDCEHGPGGCGPSLELN